jgi:universal stress protein E
MIKYRNILVVIDPNMEPQPALYRAAEVARLQDSAAIKVFMSIYDFSYEITSILSAEEREEMREGVVNLRKSWLEGLIKPYVDEGLDISLKVVWNSRPFEGIQQEVDEHRHDLVIKSAHHHSLLETFIFTPLDWQLIRKCHTPLLLVKEHGWPADGNIVVALNFSNEPEQNALNQKLFKEANHVARLVKGKVHLVNAVPSPTVNIALEVPGFTPEIYNDALMQHHQSMMEDFAKSHHIPAEQTYVLEGLPEDVLPEIAEKLDAELILLGSLGRTGWSAALIGNTAEQVVDSIHCDLLVLKPDPVQTE